MFKLMDQRYGVQSNNLNLFIYFACMCVYVCEESRGNNLKGIKNIEYLHCFHEN